MTDSRPNLTLSRARRRARGLDDLRYHLRLDLQEGAEGYRGEVAIDFLLDRARALRLDYQGREVESVRVNGRPLGGRPFRRPRISLPAKALRKGRNRVEVRFASDYDNDGMGLHRSEDPADGREYLYSVMCPFDANRVLPCFDQPDLKAPLTLEVSAPDHWEVVANAPLASRHDEGRRRVHRFAETPPFSTYLYSLAAGPFAQWVDHDARVPSRIFAVQSMAAHVHVSELFEITRQGFDFYEEYFQIPYAFSKYDQVFCPHFNWGAMENVACVLHSDSMVFRHDPTASEREDRANTFVHELAHMWFGNLATMSWWDDLWLNESFATYMASLCLARATRFTDAWQTFLQDTKAWAYWQDELVTTHPIATPVPDTDTTFTNFDGITYGKGASVLKQLAFYLGDEAFRQGVSLYLDRYRFANARLDDFLRCLAETSGVDLEGWSRLWLETAGMNVIRPEIERERGRIRRFTLVQEPGNGDGVLRPHRLKVALHRAAGRGGPLELDRVVEVEVQDRRTRVRELEGAPAPDLVEANHGDHAYARVYLDDASLAFARKHLREVPDAMQRVGLWQSLWFMVRDAALPPQEFLEVFRRAAGDEADATVLEAVLGHVWTTLGRYLEPDARPRWADELHALATRGLGAAAEGSDHAKVWLAAAVRTTRTPKARRRLRSWLEEDRPVRGLDLDPDRRWSMVERLCVLGDREAPALLERETARDRSERGAQSAFRAQASFPDPVEKERAWERFVHDEAAPLGLLREGMRGFRRREQAELLAPFTARYFEALSGELGRSRGNFFLQAFTDRLFPAEQPARGVLRRTAALLEGDAALPRAIRRKLEECADEVKRAERIRKAAR